MTKDQILEDFAFLYQRALEEDKWTLAVQIKTTQAKIRGIFASWLQQDPNSPEAAAKEQILADFAFLYQRIAEAGKWSLAFRVRNLQARILGFFIHKRPKVAKLPKPEPLTSKALEPQLPEQKQPESRWPEPQSPEPELPELPKEKLPEPKRPAPESLKMRKTLSDEERHKRKRKNKQAQCQRKVSRQKNKKAEKVLKRA